jgi:hypothetical protein
MWIFLMGMLRAELVIVIGEYYESNRMALDEV